MSLEARYRALTETLRALDPDHRVTLVAVSKTHPLEAIEALYRLGQRDFGENYVQELVGKAEAARERGLDGIRWHFIGHLQTNKAKALVPWVDVLHTLDSLRLAQEVASRWSAAGRAGRLPVLIEVNVDGEATKSGVAPGEVSALAVAVGALGVLELRGLMGLPRNPEPAFAQLAALARKLSLPWLSMGMSGDFGEAIQAGATHIRVGTALFDQRR